MTKAELLRLMLRARRSAQLNDWDDAIKTTYLALSELEERRRKASVQTKTGNVRIKAAGPGFEVFKGGVKQSGHLYLDEAMDAAHRLANKHGGQIVEVPDGVSV
jgi:hypothetical protein